MCVLCKRDNILMLAALLSGESSYIEHDLKVVDLDALRNHFVEQLRAYAPPAGANELSPEARETAMTAAAEVVIGLNDTAPMDTMAVLLRVLDDTRDVLAGIRHFTTDAMVERHNRGEPLPEGTGFAMVSNPLEGLVRALFDDARAESPMRPRGAAPQPH